MGRDRYAMRRESRTRTNAEHAYVRYAMQTFHSEGWLEWDEGKNIAGTLMPFRPDAPSYIANVAILRLAGVTSCIVRADVLNLANE